MKQAAARGQPTDTVIADYQIKAKGDCLRMPSKEISLTREELYARVWAEPMRTVAQQLGISDVGLAKKCRRMKIPVPGLGYWAKKTAGKKVKQLPLPALRERDRETPRETTVVSTVAIDGESELVAAQRAFEADPDNAIRVSETLRSAHPLIHETIAALDGTGKKDTDYVGNWRVPHLDIDVTKGQLRRAFRIMDALVKALESRGWKVANGTGDDRKSYVTIFDQRIAFGIRETIKKVENAPPTPRRSSTGEMYTPYYTKYRDEPSGKLALVLRHSWGHGVSKSRVESASNPTEERLNDFVMLLVREADEDLQRHKRWEAERLREAEIAARRRAEEERLAKIEARRAAERARLRVLEGQAARWKASRDLSAFVAAIRAHLAEHPSESAGSQMAEDWLAWADAHARALDPRNRPLADLIAECGPASEIPVEED